MRFGFIAVALLAAGAAHAETAAQICGPMRAKGYLPYVLCLHDVEHAPFLQRYPDLSGAYENFYTEWEVVAFLADKDKWDDARFAAESVKPKVTLTIAKQASDAQRQQLENQRVNDMIAADEKALKADRNRRALGAALTAFGNAGQPKPGSQTNCQTYSNGSTNCVTH